MRGRPRTGLVMSSVLTHRGHGTWLLGAFRRATLPGRQAALAVGFHHHRDPRRDVEADFVPGEHVCTPWPANSCRSSGTRPPTSWGPWNWLYGPLTWETARPCTFANQGIIDRRFDPMLALIAQRRCTQTGLLSNAQGRRRAEVRFARNPALARFARKRRRIPAREACRSRGGRIYGAATAPRPGSDCN